ncbi:hypothetical protein SALSENF004_16230 [Salmonella enterica subsp. enterica serovar Senftenberg]
MLNVKVVKALIATQLWHQPGGDFCISAKINGIIGDGAHRVNMRKVTNDPTIKMVA